MKNIIIQKESKTGVRQWHFDRIQALTFACIALIVIGVSLFFVSDQLSHYLYEKRLQEFRTNFMKMRPEEIAYPRSVNGIDKWTESHNLFKKGAPIHCKGAILYNYLLKKNKLTHKYPLIQNGEKIRFLHLREPNIYQSTSISFITELPKELDIAPLIDYDVQYEKSFVEPLKFITDKIKWNLDMSFGTQLTLEGFFS